jgi:hypothetical protein
MFSKYDIISPQQLTYSEDFGRVGIMISSREIWVV